MRKVTVGIIFLVFVVLSQSYQVLNQIQGIMAFYEQNSFMPIMHVYHNRHFSKSKQFERFLDVIQQAEYEIKQYGKIVFTDCEIEKSQQNYPCKQIAKNNQNRLIVGYQPSNKFTSFGDKVMQSPPNNKVMDHYSDTYTVEQVVNFINQMVPNFYKQISNAQQFEQFKNPRYAPKLIYASKQGEVTPVVARLGIQYFLRFDLAYVEDLTQSVINQLDIKEFPSLIVMKYNYELGKQEMFPFDSHDFSDEQYQKIKKFVSQYALSQKRNDYVFHFIKPPTQSQIITVDKISDLDQTLDKIKGWIVLSEGPDYAELVQLKNQYGLFYDYVHFLQPNLQENKLSLVNHRSKLKYPFNDTKQIKYSVMRAEDFQSNSTVWLKKGYVVVGVRQAYGHLCTIVEKALFAGLAQCFVIQEKQYPILTVLMGINFEHGFIISSRKQTNKVQGNQIKSLDFHAIYRLLQYTARSKVKQIIDEFMDHPVKNITQSVSLQELCAEPFKKCILYFSEQSKDKTKRQYLQLEAVNFINQYKVFEVDLACNKHIYDQIPQMQQSSGGLIAFHPREGKYVYLKAKMTRNVIQKFLKINNQEKRSLPFKEFTKQNIMLYNCSQQAQEQQPQDKFESQL